MKSRRNTKSLPPVSPLWARALRQADGALAQPWLYPALLAGLAFLLGCIALRSADFWWHLRTGQLILERAAVPQTDWFTFTNSNQPWIDLHWGFQIWLAGMHHIGGITLVTLAKALVLAISFYLCVQSRPKGSSAALATAVWLLALLVASARFQVRPEVLTYLFLATSLWIFSHAERKPGLLLALGPLFLVWVNCHALFILGVASLVFYLIDVGVRRGRFRTFGPPSAIPIRILGGTTLLVGIACLANPYGWTGVLFPFQLHSRLAGDRLFFREFANELMSAGDMLGPNGVAYPALRLFLLELGLGALSFVALGRRGSLSLFRLLLFFAFGYLGLAAYRNLGIAAIGVGYAICGNVLNLEGWGRDKPAFEEFHSAWGIRWQRRLLAGGILLLALTVVTGLFHKALGNGFRFSLSDGTESEGHGACRFLKDRPEIRYVFASPLSLASVCIYELGPEKKVYLDARLEVNRRETFEKYLAWIKVGDGELPAGTALLFHRSAELTKKVAQNRRWTRAYEDALTVVFVPATTP